MVVSNMLSTFVSRDLEKVYHVTQFLFTCDDGKISSNEILPCYHDST